MANQNYDKRALAVWRYYRKLLNCAELARRLGISPVSIHYWRIVPEARLKRVSKILGVPMEVLRPDLADYLTEDPWET